MDVLVTWWALDIITTAGSFNVRGLAADRTAMFVHARCAGRRALGGGADCATSFLARACHARAGAEGVSDRIHLPFH